MKKSATLRYINLAFIPSDSDLTNKNPPLSPPNKKFPAVSSPPKYSRTTTQRRPSPLRQSCISPVSDFPLFPKKISDFVENFPNFTSSHKIFWFVSTKISDNLFLLID